MKERSTSTEGAYFILYKSDGVNSISFDVFSFVFRRISLTVFNFFVNQRFNRVRSLIYFILQLRILLELHLICSLHLLLIFYIDGKQKQSPDKYTTIKPYIDVVVRDGIDR